MERICKLLNEALTPYHATLGDADARSMRDLSLFDRQGRLVLRRAVTLSQLQDQRLLVDLVDGLHRDLQIAEGRLQPCMIAALQHCQQSVGTFA
ncbi:DUF3509 domain-containing protein [Enterobacterales bacterium AW_CKDN230030176-1A_HGKHYDSX7]